MANYDDYQLEEMENSAVEKSVMAKRVAAGVGLLGVGAASTYGAEHVVNNDDAQMEVSELTEEDMKAGANAGIVDDVESDTHSHGETHSVEEVHVYHHNVSEQQETQDVGQDTEPDMDIHTTTHVYDDDGNFLGTIDSGTYGDNGFAIVDSDGDGDGDVLMYDANGNGEFEENEITDISDSDYIMGQGETHRDINIETGEEIADAHEPGTVSDDIYVDEKDDLADITNDFTDEKSGEEYSDDLAENNSDYQNDGDVDHYNAGVEHHDELAYNGEDESVKDFGLGIDELSDNEYILDSAKDDLAYDDAEDSYDIGDDSGVDDNSFDDSDAQNDYAYNDDVANDESVDDIDSFHDDTSDYEIG